MRKGVLVGLVALTFVAWVFYSLTRVEPVKVVESRLSRTGDSVSVTGRLQNTGTQPGAVEIEIRYFDTNGKSIANDTLAIGSLQPGASLTFSSPRHVLENVGSYSIYLNHGRNAYGN